MDNSIFEIRLHYQLQIFKITKLKIYFARIIQNINTKIL